MKFEEYLDSLRNKSVAVIGIGVSNTPLLRRLLAEGIAVTACDRSSRDKLGPLADELEAKIRANSFKLLSKQGQAAARAAGRAVDISADDFQDGED